MGALYLPADHKVAVDVLTVHSYPFNMVVVQENPPGTAVDLPPVPGAGEKLMGFGFEHKTVRLYIPAPFGQDGKTVGVEDPHIFEA